MTYPNLKKILLITTLLMPTHLYATNITYEKYYILPSGLSTTTKQGTAELIMLQMVLLGEHKNKEKEVTKSLLQLEGSEIEKIYSNIAKNIIKNKFQPKEFNPLYLTKEQLFYIFLHHSKNKSKSDSFLPTLGLIGIGVASSAIFKSGEDVSPPPQDPLDPPISPPDDGIFNPSKSFPLIIDTDNLNNVNLNELTPESLSVNPQNFYASGFRGQGVKVAVMDTGVDSTHFDLDDNIDITGSFSYGSDNISDNNGHGTHVAGIIAAEHNNYGTQGIAPEATILSFDILNTSTTNFIEAYKMAADNGAQIINNSWGFSHSNYADWVPFTSLDDMRKRFGSYRTTFEESFHYLKDKDVITVFSAGNDYSTEPGAINVIPAFDTALQGYWVTVASLDDNGEIADYSNHCGVAKDYCLSAPGTSILSTIPNNQYGYKTGTSMAAPLVSGSLALMRSAFPELSSPDILNILFSTATDLGESGVDEIYGHGALNLENAISPQGELVIYEGDNINSKSYALTNTSLNLGGGIANAIIQSTENQKAKIMAVDSFSRGYDVNLSSMINEQQNTESNLNLVSKHNNFDILLDVENDIFVKGNMLDYLSGSSGIRIGDEKVSLTLIKKNEMISVLTQTKIENDRFRIKTTFGESKENDSVLGGSSTGAFKNTKSNTKFFSSEMDINIDKGFGLNVVGNISNTNFNNQFISGSDIKRDEIAFAFTNENKKRKIKVGLSKPLNVQSGVVTTTLPKDRAVSINGTTSTDVIHTNEDYFVSEKDTYKINFEYSFNLKSENKKTQEFTSLASHNIARKESELSFLYKIRF